MYVIASAVIAVVLSLALSYIRVRLTDSGRMAEKPSRLLFALLSVAVCSLCAIMAVRHSGFLGLLILVAVLVLFALVYALLGVRDGRLSRLPQIKLPAWRPSTSFWAGLVASLAPTVVFALFLSLHTMPMAEGWYSVYAKLINGGAMPYTDFELLFMPLYAYIISGITALFGYKIIVLRIFGVIIFACLTALTYCVLSKLFKPWISCIATITGALFLQSEVVQIFYDYIRVFDVFAYAATLFLVLHVAKTQDDGQKHSFFAWRLALSGIFASLAFLVRQNSGALVMAYTVLVVLFLVVYTRQKKLHIAYLAEYVLAFLLPLALMVLHMYTNGALSAFLGATVGDALNSKGGIFTVLFAWIPRSLGVLVGEWWIFAALLGLLGVNFFLYRKNKREDGERESAGALFVTFLSLLVIGALLAYLIPSLGGALSNFREANLPYVVFYVVIVIFAITLVWLFKNKQSEHRAWAMRLMTLSGMAIAVGYGSGTSSGLSEGQTALCVALIIALLLYFSSHILMHAIRLTALAMALLICLSIISFKYDLPYSWWGLAEGDLRNAKYTIEGSEELSGIRVSKDTKVGYEEILSIIAENSEQGDSIFVFPHTPIFYLLSDRYPDTYTIVQWFDVASDKAVVKDIDVIREAQPKVIVYVKIDEYVVNSHESLFRGESKSGLSQMAAAIEELVYGDESSYVQAAELTIQGYDVEVYYRD